MPKIAPLVDITAKIFVPPPSRKACMTDRLQLFTIGHSTRTWQEFVDLLEERQIEYVHLEALGGMREPLKGSPNAGWKP